MMTQPPRHRYPDAIITPWHDPCSPMSLGGSGTPASGTWGTANAAQFYPCRLEDPFTVSRAFVLNGATVGTNSWDIGVYRMTDPATGRLDLIRSTGAVLSSGSVNRVAETTAFRVARTNLTSGGSSTDQDTYTTASVTLKAGRLYCLAIENSHASSAPAVSSITGGPSWTSRATTQFNGNANRVSLWTGVPSQDYTGTLDIFFGSSSGVTGAVWALDEMSGVDTSTDDGIVQTATGTGTSTTPAATLAAFASSNNATYGVQGKAANATSTPGTGFTELSDTGTATPAQSISTEWRVDNDTTVDFTITSTAWGCLAAEVKADTSPFVVPPTMPGSPDIYLAASFSGTTATLFRLSAGAANTRSMGILGRTATFPLPSTVVPTTVANNIIPVLGLCSRSILA